MSPTDPFATIAAIVGDGAPRRRISTFVALGDSFTAGHGCDPSQRWANRLAAMLDARNPDLTYRNLAVDGATSAAVLAQVGPAIQLEPDLVTVICGANDVIGSVRPDLDGYAANLEAIFDRLARSVPRVAILTATSPERWSFLELRPRTRARVVGGVRDLNDVTRRVARARGVPVLDVGAHPDLDRQENFLDDGLHPSPSGHARAALELAAALRRHHGIESKTKIEEESR